MTKHQALTLAFGGNIGKTGILCIHGLVNLNLFALDIELARLVFSHTEGALDDLRATGTH